MEVITEVTGVIMEVTEVIMEVIMEGTEVIMVDSESHSAWRARTTWPSATRST